MEQLDAMSRRDVLLVATVATAASAAGVFAIIFTISLTGAMARLWLAPVVVALAAAVPWLVRRPAAMLAVLAAAQVASLSDVAARHGIGHIHPLLLLLAMVAIMLAWRRGTVRLPPTSLLLIGAVFLATRAVAAVAASDPRTSVSAVATTAKDLVFLVIVATLLATTRRHTLFISAIVVTVASLAVLSLVQEFVFRNSTDFGGFSNVPLGIDLGSVTSRHSGPALDVNFWGRTLVLIVPMALTLAASSSRARRAGWLAATLAILAGLYLTQSRGDLIAAAVALVLWAALAGGIYRRLLLIAPVLATLLMLVPGVGSRLATLTADAPSAGVNEPSIAGRLGAQQAALHMFLDHPIAGVGPDNFPSLEPDYRRRLGLLASNPAPHNLYLQVLAESGLIGLAGWMTLLAGAAALAWRVRRSARWRPPPERQRATLLSSAVLAGLGGWVVASLFLHLSDFRTLELVLAVAAVLHRQYAVGSSRTPSLHRAAVARDHNPRRHLLLPAGAAVAVVVLCLVGALVVATRPTPPSASAPAIVVPAASQNPYMLPYGYDTLSRELIVPTYAAVASNPRFLRAAAARLSLTPAAIRDVEVDVGIAAQSSLLTITVVAPDEVTAQRLAPAVLEEVRSYVAGLRGLYQLQPVHSWSPGQPR